MPVLPTELESQEIDLSQEPGADRRDSIIKSLATGPLESPTQEQDDASDPGPDAGEDYDKTSILTDEDLTPSKALSSESPSQYEEEPETQEESEEEGDEPKTLSDEDVEADRVRRASAARLNEIRSLREKSRQKDVVLAEVQKSLAELQADRVKGKIEEELPPELVDSPAFQYFEKKRLEDRAERQEAQVKQDTANAAAQEINDVQSIGRRSAQEYIQHTPDWSDAYAYARKAAFDTAISNGATPDQVRLEETARIKGLIDAGLDPAHEIYEFALQNGYQRNGVSGPAVVPAPEAPLPEPVAPDAPESAQQAKVRRIRRGVHDSNTTQASKGNNHSNNRMLNVTEVDALLNKDQMVRLFQQNPAVFDTLAQPGGRISRSLLEGL